MAKCEQDYNTQLKGLQARLSQVEDNITNHFVGVSTAILGLLANPLTAGSVAGVAGIYNLVPAGMAALQELVKQIGALDPKKLMMQAAVSAIDGMEAELSALAGMVEDAATTLMSTAESALTAAVDAAESAATAVVGEIANLPIQVATEALNLTDAVASGIASEITTATNILHSAMEAIGGIPSSLLSALSTLTSANTAKTAAKSVHDSATALTGNVSSFFGAQLKISQCKSNSMRIG